jgi:hypothetical protein
MAVQMACERCGKQGGRFYTFHYGKESGIPEYHAPVYQPGLGTTRTETHHYQIAGSQEVPLCDGCVTKRRLLGVAKEIGNTPIMWLLALGAVIGPPALVAQGNLAAAFGVVAATVVVLWLIYTFAAPGKRIAEQMAIEMRKDSLRGWTAFWTTEEYDKLRPEVAGRFGPLAR